MLVEESTVSFAADDSGMYVGNLKSTFSATVGKTYKVSWDGTVYESTCVDFSGTTIIGNLSLMGAGSDTGEPFVMMVENGLGIAVFTADTSASHTFSISGFVSEVVKIDEKYLPEGYPTKSVGTVTLMEEQQVAFTLSDGLYMAQITNAFEIVEGQTYTVNWDGTEYECVGVISNSMTLLGNLSITGMGDDTGEPFMYGYSETDFMGIFGTLDTSASHTIGVKTTGEIVTPIAEEFLPAGVRTTALIHNLGGNRYGSKLTYDELYERLLDGKQVVLHRASFNEYLYLMGWMIKSNGDIDLTFGKNYTVTLKTDGTFVGVIA